MRAILRRVGRLEDHYETQHSGRPKEPVRVIITHSAKHADLATSTCERYLRDGNLLEVVELDGRRDHLSDEEIGKFVGSFPITTVSSWRTW
jgi:hypothetical protein